MMMVEADDWRELAYRFPSVKQLILILVVCSCFLLVQSNIVASDDIQVQNSVKAKIATGFITNSNNAENDDQIKGDAVSINPYTLEDSESGWIQDNMMVVGVVVVAIISALTFAIIFLYVFYCNQLYGGQAHYQPLSNDGGDADADAYEANENQALSSFPNNCNPSTSNIPCTSAIVTCPATGSLIYKESEAEEADEEVEGKMYDDQSPESQIQEASGVNTNANCEPVINLLEQSKFRLSYFDDESNSPIRRLCNPLPAIAIPSFNPDI